MLGTRSGGELPCLRRKTVHFRGALAPLSLALQRADAAFQHRYMQHVDAYISRLPSPEQTGKAERSPQARSFIIFRCGHHLVLRPRWSASFGAAVGGVNICIAWVGAYPKPLRPGMPYPRLRSSTGPTPDGAGGLRSMQCLGIFALALQKAGLGECAYGGWLCVTATWPRTAPTLSKGGIE